ncbi:MAG: hypothetical protein JRL30_15030, partial [Deltaproteobacteria bacterium]|nr:hypothetical protein [Deltaproteobacteria bacterium]
ATLNLLNHTRYTLNVFVGPGTAGTVTGPGIQCPGDCTEEYDSGTVISLTANEATGFRFVGWGGDISGNTNPCTVTIDADKTVIAISIPTR